MVGLVRGGEAIRSVARRFNVHHSTLGLWVARAAGIPLDEVDWADRPPIASTIHRTPDEVESLVLEIRRSLRDESILGEYGAVAIRRELAARAEGSQPLPSVRTIGRILDRRGALDGNRRSRRPAPPAGWHLPEVRARQSELDSFDVIEGLRFLGGVTLDVLTALSLHGALPGAWPAMPGVSARSTVDDLSAHWASVGLPGYAQFDNDTRFVGGLAHPNSIGPVIRLCLAVGVVPVFAPPNEMGFQASIEAFNGRWQRSVWRRVRTPGLADLRERSDLYIRAVRARQAARIEAAPPRRPFPSGPPPDLRRPPAGRLVFVRRTSDAGTVEVLQRRYPVSPLWPRRLVRAELDLDERRLQFFALRRRDPGDQPLLNHVPFEPPERWYR